MPFSDTLTLRYATERDDLTELWRLCFHEDSLYSEYRPENALVYADERRIYAMLHILPRRICCEGEMLDAGYVFGVGTHPDFRRRGLGGELVEQAMFELYLRNVPLAFLIPGSADVIGFYEAYGWQQLAQRPVCATKSFTRMAAADDIDALQTAYRTAYPNAVIRSRDDWRLILEEYRVGLGADGYCVWDERETLECVPRPDTANHLLTALVKVTKVAVFQKRLRTRGEQPSANGPDRYCAWNNALAERGAPSAEQLYLADKALYINLLHN